MPCIFKVARYTVGHNSLVLMCESLETNFVDRSRHFMTFEGVNYLQIFPSWKNSPLKLAPDNLHDSFLNKIEFEDKLKNSPLVFYTTPNKTEILIVCARIYFSTTMPKLAEYTFD